MDSGLVDGAEVEMIYKNVKFEALKVIVETTAATSSRLIISEFQQTIQNREIVSNISGLMPYLYAAGFLSFAAREINEQNMSDILTSIGIKPNPELIKVVLDIGIKSHLVYVYAFYFLLANGIDTSDDNILNVVKSLGLPPDKSRVAEVREMLSSSSSSK